jgi:hypothetical protein
MNRHLGATYTLSVLIVVSTAIAFRGPEPRPGPPKVPSAAPARDEVPRPAPARPTAAAVPDRPAVAVARVEPRPSPARIATAPAAPTPTPIEPPARPAPRTIAKPGPRRRGSFARVGPGETLADAARRLYGSDAMAEALWRANRDQLPSPSSPIETGMILRTP